MESTEKRTTLERLPEHLRTYCVPQEYSHYTPRDHSVWRFVLRRAYPFFLKHAHPVYRSGLEETGLSIEFIPKIETMDQALSKFGWGAVCVRGFVPPLIFLEFGANKVLPIAADMRSYKNLAYTSAPDIIHEAAGHAPIIADPEYRDYLSSYSRVATKAVFSSEDVLLYEAIRKLSDLKESRYATPEEINEAEAELNKAKTNVSWISEAAKVARLFWWTAEYGLVGTTDRFSIYGSGLLSSIGESQACLSESVKKITLSAACIEQDYDITEPQPQLFVARDFSHLKKVLEDVEKGLAYKRGGGYGLDIALRSKAVSTVEFDSGLQVSGVLSAVSVEGDEPSFLEWSDQVQISYRHQRVADHGDFPKGLRLLVGDWQLEDQENTLKSWVDSIRSGKIGRGSSLTLDFRQKKSVEAVVDEWISLSDQLFIAFFSKGKLSEKGKSLIGGASPLALASGQTVVSVFGGAADPKAYGSIELGKATTKPSSREALQLESEESSVMSLYEDIRLFREQHETASPDEKKQQLSRLADALHQKPVEEWLLIYEYVELASDFWGFAQAEIPYLKAFEAKIFSLLGEDSETTDIVRQAFDQLKINRSST